MKRGKDGERKEVGEEVWKLSKEVWWTSACQFAGEAVAFGDKKESGVAGGVTIVDVWTFSTHIPRDLVGSDNELGATTRFERRQQQRCCELNFENEACSMMWSSLITLARRLSEIIPKLRMVLELELLLLARSSHLRRDEISWQCGDPRETANTVNQPWSS